jgi:hypothetical protein
MTFLPSQVTNLHYRRGIEHGLAQGHALLGERSPLHCAAARVICGTVLPIFARGVSDDRADDPTIGAQGSTGRG